MQDWAKMKKVNFPIVEPVLDDLHDAKFIMPLDINTVIKNLTNLDYENETIETPT